MKQNNAQNSKYHFDIKSQAIAVGANAGYAMNLENLHSYIAAINTDDGIRKQIRNVTIKVRAHVEDSQIFSILPVVVQTAGQFVDNISLLDRRVDSIIATAIDDVFGYDCIGNFRVSKIKPTGDGTLATTISTVETTFQLSQKHLQILNKEVESERLQDLYLGIVGVSSNTGTSIYVYYHIEVQYTELRQKVVIR